MYNMFIFKNFEARKVLSIQNDAFKLSLRFKLIICILITYYFIFRAHAAFCLCGNFEESPA